ncbi:MAG: hypothetical protein ACLQVF_13155 [Isosphaeraceae bacterium]
MTTAKQTNIRSLCLQRLSLLFQQWGADGLLRLGDDIAANHFPDFEPYNAMNLESIATLTDQAYNAGDIRKWLMLEQFILDKLDGEELTVHDLTVILSTRLMKELDVRSLETANLVVSLTYEFVLDVMGQVRENKACGR